MPVPTIDAADPDAHRAAEHPLVAGHRVGRYTIEALLGRGGMGEVYCAHDERLDRRVALKLLRRVAGGADLRARRRLLREARAASALNHPGIVTVHEIGEDRGRTFIVMELVEGETVKALLERRGRLAPAEALAILGQLAEAVHAVHEAGLVHRDLKPANLMIDRRGRLRIVDFGLSKRLTGRRHPRAQTGSHPKVLDARGDTIETRRSEGPHGGPGAWLVDLATEHTVCAESPLDACPAGSDDVETAHGVVMGTPGYAAPELMAGELVGVRSDVFSLGVIAYELLTGRRPFEGVSVSALRVEMVHGPVKPASVASGGAVGAAVDAVLASALAARPAGRPDDAGTFITALRAAATSPPPARRRRVRWSGGLVACVTASLALAPTAPGVGPARGASAADVPGAARAAHGEVGVVEVGQHEARRAPAGVPRGDAPCAHLPDAPTLETCDW